MDIGGDYTKELATICQPLPVAVGTADEAFLPEQSERVVTAYTPAKVELLPGGIHMGLVVGSKIRPVVEEWPELL